jgi:hypothetical protein
MMSDPVRRPLYESRVDELRPGDVWYRGAQNVVTISHVQRVREDWLIIHGSQHTDGSNVKVGIAPHVYVVIGSRSVCVPEPILPTSEELVALESDV